MEFKTVTYLAAYPHPELGTFAPLKLGLEIYLNEEGDTVEKALDTAKEKLDNWNAKNNKSIWSTPEGMTGTHIHTVEGSSKEVDEAYDNLIAELEKIEFQEDAQAYLETTDFKFTISAKNIVNNKPLKNK